MSTTEIANRSTCTTPPPEGLILETKGRIEGPSSSQRSGPTLTVKVLHRSALTEFELQPIKAALDQWQTMCIEILSGVGDIFAGKEPVEDAEQMSGIVSSNLTLTDYDPTEKVLCCTESASAKIQGVAVVYETKRLLIIRDIVTNPENIRGVLTTTDKAVRGVGTALVAESARQCLSSGKSGVFLKALWGAQEFYKNCGFEVLDSSKTWLPSMFLSVSSMPRLMKEGVSLTPGISCPHIISKEEVPLSVSKGEPSTVFTSLEQRIQRLRSKMNDLVVDVLPQPAAPYNTRGSSAATFLQKRVDHISRIVSCWIRKSSKALVGSKETKKNVLTLLTATYTESAACLKGLNPSRDMVCTFSEKRNATIRGVAVFSTKEKMYSLRSFIVNPAEALTSKNVTYAQMIDRVATAMISQITAMCVRDGKEGVFMKALNEEKVFFENRGFENVDTSSNQGRIRIVAMTQSLTASERK